MPTKSTNEVTEGAEFLGCTPFFLVQERKKRRTRKASASEPAHWLDAFQSDQKMGQEEAHARLASYNTEIRDLFDQAMRGDEFAALVLVEFASGATRALDQLVNRNPSVLHPMSENQIEWPAFIGTKDFHLERNRNLIKKLKLGHKSPLNHKWNPKSPATFTAYSMLHWLVENESVLRLPAISKATLDVWFEKGWQGFSACLNGQPEKYKFLRAKIEPHAEKESARKQEKRNPETVIRTKMKDAVRQSFKSVTKKHLL